MRIRRASRVVLLSALLSAAGPPLHGQEGFRAWMGLHDSSQLGWLENENRLGELCPDSATLGECYREVLGPLVRAYDLYVEPDTSSVQVGELIVVATPGRGLSAHFRQSRSDEGDAFLPDLFLQDWGYGPYFHHTLLDRRGDWYRLPAGPWSGAVWLRRAGEDRATVVMEVYPEYIVEMGGSGWYVVATESDALHLRPEQPGDMWCVEGEPPPIAAVEPARFAREELLDSLGHLVIRPKYLKGC